MDADIEYDRRLAARAGAGDERAFTELVDRHREPLLRYVSRRFSPELAEDAVQEALLSAHRALVGGTVPSDVRAWLATIAWRRALDMTRRERESLPLDADVAAGVASEPEARVLQTHELGRVVAAFSELPERQRTALALSALEGRSLEEIGDALDVPAGAAKSLVARSRRTLTHRLAAADLCCDRVRVEMEASAQRGVRLSGEVTLHLRACRACKRAHREIRGPAARARGDALPAGVGGPHRRAARSPARPDRDEPRVGGAGQRGQAVHRGVPDRGGRRWCRLAGGGLDRRAADADASHRRARQRQAQAQEEAARAQAEVARRRRSRPRRGRRPRRLCRPSWRRPRPRRRRRRRRRSAGRSTRRSRTRRAAARRTAAGCWSRERPTPPRSRRPSPPPEPTPTVAPTVAPAGG